MTLTCKGKVLVAFKASPRLANFRQVEANTTPMPQTVTITRGDGGPLDLKVTSTGKPGIETYLEEVTPGEKYKLIISLGEGVQPGSLRSWVKLTTGIEQVPETTVPVYATIPAS